MWDSIAQEVEIETGRVLFEWRSLEHVGIEESYAERSEDRDYHYDYFHINSTDVAHDDNLIISSRNTCTVYKVDRNSGEILWQLGGKKSDFKMGPGTQSAWQHDARRHEDGTITVFDNGAHPQVHDQSRGIVLEIDEEKMSATLLQEYTSPQRLLTTSQGNVQILPNANVLIGWRQQWWCKPAIPTLPCGLQTTLVRSSPPAGPSSSEPEKSPREWARTPRNLMPVS